jgi:Na+/H+-dicarboxylate symporter
MVQRVRQFLVPVAAFGLGAGIAELAGAANLGTAFGVGQIAFALAVLGVLLR